MLMEKAVGHLALIVAGLLASGAVHASSFKIVPEKSRVRFEVGHHDYAKPVKGRFHRLSGEIKYDVNTPSYTSMEVVIDPASIDTDNSYRDSHLRSSFFEVEQYPEIVFELTKIRPGEEVIEGTLTMKGVTQPVTLEISRLRETTDSNGIPVLNCRATAVVNRREFGVAENAEGTSGLKSILSHIQEGLDEFIEDVVEINISITAHAISDYADDMVNANVL